MILLITALGYILAIIVHWLFLQSWMQNFRCTKWFLRHSWWRKLNPESAATQDAELNDLPDRVNNPNDCKNSNNRACKPHVDLYTGTS